MIAPMSDLLAAPALQLVSAAADGAGTDSVKGFGNDS